MANEFICSDCKGDGTRCDCHTRRAYPYVPSYEEQQHRLRVEEEIELNRLRRKFKLPPIKIGE